MPTWDPTTYLRYADERSRPFADLVARVPGEPAHVVDLGCGPGHLSAMLLARWPAARIQGIDSSPEMIERARSDNTDERVTYSVGDVRDWRTDTPVDLLVSNATFQWVPGHLEVLPRLAQRVAPGGAFAWSVPGNFDQPSHVILRNLAADSRFAEHAGDVVHPHAHDPMTYLYAVGGPGWHVDAWETTYLHVLQGPDPVFRWVSGTGARPILQALTAELRDEFVKDYKAQLAQAYPARPFGTVLPFRRVFVVASRTNR
ncbi:MAG: methyltransferase domain-containing protein [Nocardioidaceae bacterium]